MSATVKDRGLLNRAIDALPFELHIPGYQFCGPGSHLEKRLIRGDRGINPLDAACREYEIAYSRSNDLAERHVAEKIFAEKAQKRIIARNSTLGERAAAATVWAAMKAKTKIGMGTNEDEEKDSEKTSTSDNETRWYIANFANVGHARIINRWSGRCGKGGQRQQNTRRQDSRSCNATIARWKATDCILLHTNMERDYISACTNVDRV